MTGSSFANSQVWMRKSIRSPKTPPETSSSATKYLNDKVREYEGSLSNLKKENEYLRQENDKMKKVSRAIYIDLFCANF